MILVMFQFTPALWRHPGHRHWYTYSRAARVDWLAWVYREEEYLSASFASYNVSHVSTHPGGGILGTGMGILAGGTGRLPGMGRPPGGMLGGKPAGMPGSGPIMPAPDTGGMPGSMPIPSGMVFGIIWNKYKFTINISAVLAVS